MLIRNYDPKDYSGVESLWKATGIYKTERSDSAEIILRCNQAGGKFLVIEDPANGMVAGTSWMTWDGRRLFLHHFAIAPALQGLGYGRRLALESLAFAREKNCPVKLEVHSQNIPAVNLYRSLGFEIFEGYDVYIIKDPGRPVY
jgi:ribosomal protein S18 acetylase RimI-like enzyme